jgi:hypothetical protein
MGKVGGPMNFGFNSNVRVGDVTYHVQTEDRGPSHPFLDTVVYVSGRVIYKRSTNYEKFAGGAYAETLAQKLHERLAQQHREVIAELESGALPPQEQQKTPAAQSLSLQLRNPKTWFAAGKVVLEIELRDVKSKQPVEGAEVQACVEHEKHRIPCAEETTDAQGLATLTFPMPANVPDGASLVVRATDGERLGELRFRLKPKPRESTPAPVTK